MARKLNQLARRGQNVPATCVYECWIAKLKWANLEVEVTKLNEASDGEHK